MSREVVEVDRLSMSLDAIISQHRQDKEKQKKPTNTSSSLVVRNNTRRSDRQNAPYSLNRKGKILNYAADIIDGDYCVKFLLTNYLSGIFIGNGGGAIREMMDITHALIHISNLGENYPGTKERVVYIKGTLASVILAQSLVWEMIGQQKFADKEPTEQGGRRNLSWDPSGAKEKPGDYDDVEVENRISIPQAVAGAVIGRNGSGLRQLSEDCGISVTIDSKEDGEVTQERLISLAGSVAGCMKCTSLILKKLAGLREMYSYFHNGSTYPKYVRESSQKPTNANTPPDSSHATHRSTRLSSILDAGNENANDTFTIYLLTLSFVASLCNFSKERMVYLTHSVSPSRAQRRSVRTPPLNWPCPTSSWAQSWAHSPANSAKSFNYLVPRYRCRNGNEYF